MKYKAILILIVVVLLGFINTQVFAMIYPNNPIVLKDMKEHPKNYIFVGSENFGLSFYIDKSSINVHKYNPPEYIIAFKSIYHIYGPLPPLGGGERAGTDDGLTRYKYDYTTQKMYIETKSNNVLSWEYVDTHPLTSEYEKKKGILTGGDRRWYIRKIEMGEIAFLLAYNTSFFKSPKGELAKQFLNGKCKTFVRDDNYYQRQYQNK